MKALAKHWISASSATLVLCTAEQAQAGEDYGAQETTIEEGQADEAEARPINGLSLRGSVTFLGAKYTEYDDAPESQPDLVNAGAIQLAPIDAAGNRTPYAAKTTFNIGGEYTFRFGEPDVTLTADWYHNSVFVYESNNMLRQGPYDLVNARSAISSPKISHCVSGARTCSTSFTSTPVLLSLALSVMDSIPVRL